MIISPISISYFYILWRQDIHECIFDSTLYFPYNTNDKELIVNSNDPWSYIFMFLSIVSNARNIFDYY